MRDAMGTLPARGRRSPEHHGPTCEARATPSIGRGEPWQTTLAARLRLARTTADAPVLPGWPVPIGRPMATSRAAVLTIVVVWAAWLALGGLWGPLARGGDVPPDPAGAPATVAMPAPPPAPETDARGLAMVLNRACDAS